MQLLSADIQGFKSFAKRVHVSFGPGITGVVGPNGSGKSNIAEAIRWVLGEQSVKALRAKERTDVLYSGSIGTVDRAFVQLTFDNESGKFPIDAAEIAIARTLYRDGESSYTVNGEDVRLLDLQHMLAQAGIGTKSYAVISQGTVNQYLTATPAARRELFDEATGIKPLKITLNTSNLKLARAKTHADEIRAVLAELTPKVTFLQRQIDRYEKRDAWEREFKEKQHEWYTAAWHEGQRAILASQTALQEAEQDIIRARNARIAAEEAKMESVVAPQATVPTTPFTTQARALLRASEHALASILGGKSLDNAELQKLIGAITALLEEKQAPAQKTASQNPDYTARSAALERARQDEIASERQGATARIGLQQAEREAAELEQEILRECGTEFLSRIPSTPIPETAFINPEELRRLADKISAVGQRDELVVKEYEEASKRAQEFSQQLGDIERTMQDIERCITEVTAQMDETFARQFEQINTSFQKFFIELFGGGSAHLTQNDEGIDITVTPPRKRTRHVSLLSGGERALTSLALLLSILNAQEPPFIVLDEVDAALDEANSRRFAMLLKQQSHTTQSIVISHNRETMASANVLYGVTMHADGVSTLYSVKLEEIAQEHLDAPTIAV